MTDDDDDDLFLPEPETREVLATIISVDDHLVEPADMFDGRLPARLATTGAFNDWVLDAWWQPHPERIIPLGITWKLCCENAAALFRHPLPELVLPEGPST